MWQFLKERLGYSLFSFPRKRLSFCGILSEVNILCIYKTAFPDNPSVCLKEAEGREALLMCSERMNILPFLSSHTDTADNSSERGAGSVILSDASSQHNLAFSSEHMVGTQQVPNLSQTENSSVQGHIYTSQQLMGHYQSNAGVRGLLFS